MTYDWTLYLILFLALWSAVIGGVFSAFSEFIMAGLLRAGPKSGIESMQAINKTVIPTQFVAGIFIISIAATVFAFHAYGRFEGAAQIQLIAAAVVYVASVFLMTLFGNVPMNNKLESLDPSSDEAAAYWQIYGRRWTRLNHVRSIGSVLTAALYVFAALSLISSGQV